MELQNRYYHNITSNTLGVLEAMAAHGVNTLIYSSTCATYGEPEKMPITEETPQVSYNLIMICLSRLYDGGSFAQLDSSTKCPLFSCSSQ